MKTQALREVTDWSQKDYRVPQHIYIVNGDKLIGYIKEGTNELIKLYGKDGTGLRFVKSNRKFQKVKI